MSSYGLSSRFAPLPNIHLFLSFPGHLFHHSNEGSVAIVLVGNFTLERVIEMDSIFVHLVGLPATNKSTYGLAVI